MSRIIIQNGNMKDNIPGWPYYHVSRDGKVYSRKSGNWKLLRGGIIKGDPAVTLSNHGNHLSQRVYRLVALVYLPKPSSTKLVIRHLDDNPLNNHVDNLRWGTQKQNMEDARKNGKLRGSSCKASRAKLSKKDLILIFKLKAKGLYYKDIAKRLGVSVGTIGRVINKNLIEMKILIENGNVCSLDLPLKFAQKLYAEFAIRHPNAFYLRTRQRGMQNWDGKIHYVNKHGEFKIGLLPAVYEKCIEYGIKPKVVDMRQPLPKVNEVVTKIGEYKLRPEQEKAVKSVINNKVGKVPFQIGVLDYTVNAGKTLIMSSLYLSYKKQLKTLLITNDSDWLNQARDEFKKYLPGEQITFVQGKVLNWSNFTIGMVQSISRNMRFYQNELAKVDMVLVDEADQAGSKQYQNVLTRLFNTRVRIGLSGTIYMSKLAKDKVKNMNLEVFFGKVLAEFKLKDSIKKGYSTRTIVKMVPSKPWYGNWESEEVSYKEVYDDSITFNKYARKMVYDRLKWNIKQGRYPALVVCKFIAHCEKLCKYFKKKLGSKYNIACVHVDTPSKIRQQIMKDFREGKIDILVSTTIIARGKNFPKLRYLLNAASMDSQEKSIQFLGRLVRTDSSKKKVYLDDLHYPGPYLNRHGKHRKQYYQKQELKVILLEKIWKKHPIHSL